MNAMIRQTGEVDVASNEATEAKIDALRDSLDEGKADVRELRGDISSLRDKVDKNYSEMHAGFAALRESIASVQTGLQTKIDSLQASLHAKIDGVQAGAQANFNSLQTSIAGVQASVAALHGMMTMFWAIGVAAALATAFLTAGKALHWFWNP
jgi:uncharacterized protein involved in exopolysaccharide biosynthesis